MILFLLGVTPTNLSGNSSRFLQKWLSRNPRRGSRRPCASVVSAVEFLPFQCFAANARSGHFMATLYGSPLGHRKTTQGRRVSNSNQPTNFPVLVFIPFGLLSIGWKILLNFDSLGIFVFIQCIGNTLRAMSPESRSANELGNFCRHRTLSLSGPLFFTEKMDVMKTPRFAVTSPVH